MGTDLTATQGIATSGGAAGGETTIGKAARDVASRRLVIFDWDGTLANTVAGIISVAREALLGWGIAEEDLGDLTRLVGPPFPQAFERAYGLSREDAMEVTRRYRAVYNAGGVEQWPAFPGVADMLCRLRAAGKLLAIASSKGQGLIDRGVDDNDLRSLFDVCLGKQDDLTDTKAKTIARVIELMGLSASDAVMVGDRDVDVLAATEAGIPCVGVLYGGTGTTEELLGAGAVAVCPTVGDLTALLLG